MHEILDVYVHNSYLTLMNNAMTRALEKTLTELVTNFNAHPSKSNYAQIVACREELARVRQGSL
jgi:hypothetical protein